MQVLLKFLTEFVLFLVLFQNRQILMITCLILLIQLVACRANIKEMIETYLDKMTVRAGYSVNSALDKALTRTGHAPDWEIYKLKRDVIDQAQEMFRPLAKSVLIDSFRPSILQKRAGQDYSTSSEDSGFASTSSSPQSSNPTKGTEYNPAKAFNMRLSEGVKNFILAIRDRLAKVWNYVLEKLNLGKIKEWFSRKQQASAANENEPKVEGSNLNPAANASLFERFKTIFTNRLSVSKVQGVVGVSVLIYLIYAFFFKKSKAEESDEYFE